MAVEIHPAAPHHLPSFLAGPDGSDPLLTVTAVVLAAAVLLIGVAFFWLHSLPERLAHKSHKLQFEVVAVLCLLALFTHTHAFWVAALLLALVDLPDVSSPVARIAGALERLAPPPAPGSAPAADQTGPQDGGAPQSALRREG